MKKLFKKTIAFVAMTLIGGGMTFAQSQAVSDFADKESINTSQIEVIGKPLGDCVEYHITGTVTWDNFSYIVLANSVVVDPGAHLIIKDAVVGFPNHMFISVAATGKLTLQNTRLTNTNASTPNQWWGLFIGGNPFNASAAAQGLLTMTNSVIENAEAAIRTYFISNCQSWANSEGGLVQATGSTFSNNGVHLWARGSTLPRYFNNCVFEITENTSGNVLAELYNVHKVAFNGCSFSCNATLSKATYGINSFASSFLVDNYCSNPLLDPCPTANIIRSSFTNLDYGICADGGNTIYAFSIKKMMVTSIKNAIFTNNKEYGACLHNMTAPVFSGCEVTTGTDQLSTGLYLTNCRYYKMQNNTFTGHEVGEDRFGVGIYVRSSRAGDHKIYRNDFYNLHMGLVPIGQNCDLVELNNGLKMNCNRFYNGWRDIAMVEYESENAEVAWIQGHDLTSSQIGPNPKNWVRNWYTAPCINQNKWFVGGSSKEIYHASHAGANTSPLPQPQCSSPLLTIKQMTPSYYNYTAHCPDQFTPRTMSELETLIADYNSDINARKNTGNKSTVANARDIAHQELELQSLITEQIMLYLEMDTPAGYAAADSLMQAHKSQTDTDLIMDAIAAEEYTLAQSLLNALSLNDNYADFCERQALHIAFRQALAADSSNWVTLLEELMAFTYPDVKPVPTTIIIPPFKDVEAEQEDAEAADFKLFPNPAQEQITFEYPYVEGATVTVDIYNLAGQLIDCVTMTGNRQAYSAEHLTNSIYFATLKVDGKIVSTQKMVLIK